MYSYSNNGLSLTISGLNQTDEGRYFLIAVNPAGEHYGHIDIIIHGKGNKRERENGKEKNEREKRMRQEGERECRTLTSYTNYYTFYYFSLRSTIYYPKALKCYSTKWRNCYIRLLCCS